MTSYRPGKHPRHVEFDRLQRQGRRLRRKAAKRLWHKNWEAWHTLNKRSFAAFSKAAAIS